MQIGIIGLGDMGKLYARTFLSAGYRVCGTDRAAELERLHEEMAQEAIELLPDGYEVSRKSDYIFYCVEAEKIEEVVSLYGHATKYGAIVGGQTSVKTPEIKAFEKFLPSDTHIVTCHSLHGPAFATENQTLVVIRHRASDAAYARALDVLKSLKSKLIELPDYHTHDKIVADTQAVTHMGFESMGSAWANAGYFPWDNPSYAGGIDNVKILTTLRIFSYKSHIYAGLAILNPFAREQIKAYAQAVASLYKWMIREDEQSFRANIEAAKAFVFHGEQKFLLLDESVMQEFSMADEQQQRMPNSHLSLMSMVYAWYLMGVNPYDNLICQTPPFRLRLGIAEYLFKNEALLEESIQAALYNKEMRGDDLDFHTAVHEWTSIIYYGDMDGYKAHFHAAQQFFSNRLLDAQKLSADMIRKLM